MVGVGPRLLLATILVAVIAFATFGGVFEPLPEVQGRWRMSGDELESARFGSPAVRAAFFANLSRLIEPFRRLPVLNPPKGFDVRWNRWIGGSFDEQRRWAITGSVNIQFFDYYRSCPTCPTQLNGESPAGFLLWVNSIDSLYDEGEVARDEGGGIHYEPPVVGEVHGFKRYERGIVIPSRPVPLFVPVTRARFLRSKITAATAAVQRWARRKEKDSSDITQERLAQEELRALERELESMPQAVRQSQAWCCDYSQTVIRPSTLAEAGLSRARPLVSTNWSYFDRTKLRSALQLIIVRGHTPSMPPHLVRAYETVLQTLDWKALAGLLTR